MVEMEEELLTAAEVAQRLHRCEETVWRWLRAGQLRGLRLRGRYLVPASSLSEFVEVVGVEEN